MRRNALDDIYKDLTKDEIEHLRNLPLMMTSCNHSVDERNRQIRKRSVDGRIKTSSLSATERRKKLTEISCHFTINSVQNNVRTREKLDEDDGSPSCENMRCNSRVMIPTGQRRRRGAMADIYDGLSNVEINHLICYDMKAPARSASPSDLSKQHRTKRAQREPSRRKAVADIYQGLSNAQINYLQSVKSVDLDKRRGIKSSVLRGIHLNYRRNALANVHDGLTRDEILYLNQIQSASLDERTANVGKILSHMAKLDIENESVKSQVRFKHRRNGLAHIFINSHNDELDDRIAPHQSVFISSFMCR
ncbi:uncharacterized protein LOC141904259 [Tubulanus polymorphus]|uniref:uncharacterized protein LOC141904259 n=1 Tax=Tubulanus polymorphus TaxID=672921 RepID=UPI003DA2024B